MISDEKLNKYALKFQKATLMDDLKFRQVCKSKEIYVNMKAAVKDKKLKEFFKIMTTNNYTNEKMFPKLTRTKIDVNNMELGDKDMSGIAKEIYEDSQGPLSR